MEKIARMKLVYSHSGPSSKKHLAYVEAHVRPEDNGLVIPGEFVNQIVYASNKVAVIRQTTVEKQEILVYEVIMEGEGD